MNAKTAKFLRKSAKALGLPYKMLKHSFEKKTKEQQELFLLKWSKEAKG